MLLQLHILSSKPESTSLYDSSISLRLLDPFPAWLSYYSLYRVNFNSKNRVLPSLKYFPANPSLSFGFEVPGSTVVHRHTHTHKNTIPHTSLPSSLSSLLTKITLHIVNLLAITSTSYRYHARTCLPPLPRPPPPPSPPPHQKAGFPAMTRSSQR